MLYVLLRALTGIALQWFYRDIEVAGAERIPRRGPLLVAVNHPNSLIDALVAVHVVPRRLLMTAKATLWDNFFLRQLFNRVGVVPLQRASDEPQRDPGQRFDPARNEVSFDAILDALAREKAVLIFPEGQSHGEPALAPLRTGLARIALQARDGRGLQGLSILPIGLTFETKWKPRSRIFVHVAEPILLDGLNVTASDAVRALTAEVGRRMWGATLNFATADDAERVIGVSRIIARAFDQARPLGAPEPPLAQEVAIARRVDAVQAILRPGVSERADRFLARLEALRAELAAREIPAGDVEVSTRLSRAAWFAIRESAIILVAGPVAWWGRVNHWVPLRLTRWASCRWSKNPEDPAVYEVSVGLGLVLLAYVIQTAIVWSIAGTLWAALYLVSLPAAATWDIRFRDRMRRAAQRVQTYFHYRRDPNLQRRLASEFSWLREEALDLEHEALLRRGVRL